MNGKGRIDMSFFVKHKAKVQLMLLAAAAIFTAYGALRGEADTVLAKAIRICLECVGIG